jgi:ubiquinone/menaquinone biosynthesis C-methylase UbiE
VSRRRNHPIFARVYDRLTRACEGGWEGDAREELCAGVTGRVLEVGAGGGANFAHYRDAALVVGSEPEPTMARQAQGRARGAAVPVRVIRADAEDLPFADRAFDAVVCSLVLCTIGDPDRALAEIRRVLRPDGVLRVYEHVRSSSRRVAGLQDIVNRPWGLIAGQCHPNRDTSAALERAGFTLRLRAFRPPVPGGWFLPHVIGEARPTAAAAP